MKAYWGVLFSLIAHFAIGHGLFAQWRSVSRGELADHLQHNSENYGRLEEYMLDYDIHYYRDRLSSKIAESYSSRIWVAGENYKAEQTGILTIQDKALRISVDTMERLVLLAEPEEWGFGFDRSFFDQVLSKARGIELDQQNGSRFRIHLPEAMEHEMVEIVFDEAGWMMELAIFWRRPPMEEDLFSPAYIKPKLVVIFKRPVVLPDSFDRKDLSTTSIVRSDGDQHVLLGRWKGFRLIDTRIR